MPDKKPVKKKKKDTLPVRIVPMDKVSRNNFNYNRQSNFIFDKQKESILHFGFVEPITCRTDPNDSSAWEIINGEHRYIALTEIFESGETVYIDPPGKDNRAKLKNNHIPIRDLGELADAEAKKLCVVLNETKGQPNQDDLADLIADLKHDEIDLSVLPYTDEELDSYLRLASGNLDVDPDDIDDADDDNVPIEEYDNQNDVIELCVTLFSLDSMPREVIDRIYPIYIRYMKEEKVLRSESWKGLEKWLIDWDIGNPV